MKLILLITGIAIVVVIVMFKKPIKLDPPSYRPKPRVVTPIEIPPGINNETRMNNPGINESNIQNENPMNKIDHVMYNLYISGWNCAMDEELLKKHNIKYILCINKENKKSEQIHDMYKRLGITWMDLELDDHPNEKIHELFEPTFNFIENSQEKGNVLVHCTAGMSRSAAIVTKYLMKKLKHKDGRSVTREEAYNILKQKRPIVNINPGFYEQLML